MKAEAGADPVPTARRASGAAERLDAALAPYRATIASALRQAVTRVRTPAPADAATAERLSRFYGQMEYHFGWRDASLAPATARPGKLLRPVLVLLAHDLAHATPGNKPGRPGRDVAAILPAALAIELVHNFSLIHDDIEDGDERRHHRPTLWTVWGQPQAINTGDGMFALARLTLLDLAESGVPDAVVLRLCALLDLTCLRLCEGQFLDMSFEGQHDITPALYLNMIERKTAALMECALEFGARLAGLDGEAATRYAAFGNCLGVGFQLRDDILGIWASDGKLGKDAAGDLRRRKMTLPTIHALATAGAADRAALEAFLAAEGAASDASVAGLLAILERTGARAAALAALRARSVESRRLLDTIAAGAGAGAAATRAALAALVDYIEADLPDPPTDHAG
ncbi:MAG TPA: polyprenyl synthetase family protein [Ktedonobacterales bacterium]